MHTLNDYKLTLDFIPISGQDSLYNFLKRTNRLGKWQGIKDELILKYKKKCQVCDLFTPVLEAHEVWEYDEITCIQTLKEIQLLCGMCHQVKHINFFHGSKIKKHGVLPSSVSKQDLINHFCKVNQCSEEDYYRLEREAFKILRMRNKVKWKRDFGKHYEPVYEGMLLKFHLTNNKS